MKQGTQIYKALKGLVEAMQAEETKPLGQLLLDAERELEAAKDTPLAKLKPGEPIFLLRAQDQHAPGLVIQWANRARKHGTPAEKCDDAADIAQAMEDYPNRKLPD